MEKDEAVLILFDLMHKVEAGVLGYPDPDIIEAIDMAIDVL